MPSFFKKRQTTKAKQKDFARDPELLQLHAETQQLLRLVNTPTKSASVKSSNGRVAQCEDSGSPTARQRPPQRMTIEVLDEDEDEDDEAAAQASAAAASTSASKPMGNAPPPFASGPDSFAFNAEEARVRKATDTFYPDVSPAKRAMDRQVQAYQQERVRLDTIEDREQREAHRKQSEISQHQGKHRNRIDDSAVKIQAHSRGFLCRRRMEKQQAASAGGNKAVTEKPADQWHQVRDVERGEVWYYNALTGQSQWDRPADFPSASLTAAAIDGKSTPRRASLSLLPLLPTNQIAMTRSSSERSIGLSQGFDLPQLSPACSSACSSSRSQASEPMLSGRTNNQGFGSTRKASDSGPRPSRTTSNLPALQPEYLSGLPNPWDCDSVVGTDDSICSERTYDDGQDADDSDEPAIARRRRSSLEKQDEAEQEDAESGDWQVNDTLFRADGTRNSKLRDTIRHALQVSKFDSISSLIASNVTLRMKPVKGRQTESTLDDINRNNQKASKQRGREIVLGKKDAPMFVAVLANDRHKLRPGASPSRIPGESEGSRSFGAPKSSTKKGAKTRARADNGGNSLTSPPRIRDLVDPGLHDDLPSSPSSPTRLDSDSASKNGSPAVCFNCWSSSNGRYCEIHRDPNENRKVKSSESALMCANWDLDQLRRKYRAEEIQEVFMKQNASLRYDKRLKQYITVVECKHPIYRAMDQLITSWNKTMRRKIHTRAWFRSFIEQLRAGRVPKADSSTPALMKLKNTIQNNKWCTKYSDTVREFHPKAPVTVKNQSGQAKHIPDVIMIHPAHPQMRHWVLVTEYTKPIELYKPRKYELPPKRCVPMPTPSFIDEIPLPVPNIHIDCGHIASWFERMCARVSTSALNKAVMQINACSPPPGVTEARRTKHVTPVTVMFATFGHKPTKGNIAVGGLSAELLIHMLVTTYIPAQFGNFVVFDRRAIAPLLTKDHDANYECLTIEPATLDYVFRALEHALNTRRPPCIVLAARISPQETDAIALANRRFPLNRPEQTGEEEAHGFRTFWLVDAFKVPDYVASVQVQPNSDILSTNTTSMHTTMTTKVDRFYPFCIPTTKENTPIEFIHLLWIGQSSRNQPQVFTTLGAQQPGEFMKNSNPDGALGPCTSIIYRSWAYMQSSPVEEFTTDDGIAYWYDKTTGETFWTRPILPAENHRGKDGDIDGVIVHGEGEVATLGIGVEDVRYTQQTMRKYMTKTMEPPEATERRVKQVAASAKKHDLVVDLSSSSTGNRASTAGKNELKRIQVPKLSFGATENASTQKMQTKITGNTPQTVQPHAPGSVTKEDPATASVGFDQNTKNLIDTITQALGSAIPGLGHGSMSGGVDMLQLGIGLGMGLGIRSQQQQAQHESASPTKASVKASSIAAGAQQSQTSAVSERDIYEDDELSTTRSTVNSDGSLSTSRSTISIATSIDITPSPDEMLSKDAKQRHPSPAGHNEKKPGYNTHAAPGEGVTWVPKPIDSSGESQTAVEGFGGALHQRVACLPKDFVTAVSSTKTCKMQANYLPVVKNMNQPRSVGFVKPRSALEEWLMVGYSPWCAGRSVFGTQFIGNLMLRPEVAEQVNAIGAAPIPANPTAASAAAPVQVEKRENLTQAMKESQELSTILSLCRHGKYDEIEVMLNSPDWTLNIDAMDATGNTLLSIACQNNNKRIAKLCLRRGADINTQNLNGQSVLHYCHEYGFHDLMDYLMEKGARDDILNSDGLTCYEGLTKEAVDSL